MHERDILLPLGLDQAVRADEVAACLRYVAALAPALAVNTGAGGEGTLAISATDPDIDLVVDIGDDVVVTSGATDTDLRLTGDAVELVDALSHRRPLDQPIPEESAWIFWGLAEAFDVGSD